MKLCLDCGNTRLKWGLWDHGGWRATGALPSAEAAQLMAALAAGGIDASARSMPVIACNVAGPAVAQTIEATLPWPVGWNTAQRHQGGVQNCYDQPTQLGADRWAALIGARALAGARATVVVMAGTATTIDVLDAAGHFQGGLILPGLDLMRTSLARNTAQLPPAPGRYQALPRNTLDAITSGTLHATLGAIARMHALAATATDELPLCLISGGAGPTLLPHLTLPCQGVDNLVLEGLARIETPS